MYENEALSIFVRAWGSCDKFLFTQIPVGNFVCEELSNKLNHFFRHENALFDLPLTSS